MASLIGKLSSFLSGLKITFCRIPFPRPIELQRRTSNSEIKEVGLPYLSERTEVKLSMSIATFEAVLTEIFDP